MELPVGKGLPANGCELARLESLEAAALDALDGDEIAPLTEGACKAVAVTSLLEGTAVPGSWDTEPAWDATDVPGATVGLLAEDAPSGKVEDNALLVSEDPAEVDNDTAEDATVDPEKLIEMPCEPSKVDWEDDAFSGELGTTEPGGIDAERPDMLPDGAAEIEPPVVGVSAAEP